MSVADWQYVAQNPWAYSQAQIQQIAQSAGVSVPEMQSVMNASVTQAASRQQAAQAAANANYKPPEIQATKDIAQIDPTHAAITSGVENAYNKTVQSAAAAADAQNPNLQAQMQQLQAQIAQQQAAYGQQQSQYQQQVQAAQAAAAAQAQQVQQQQAALRSRVDAQAAKQSQEIAGLNTFNKTNVDKLNEIAGLGSQLDPEMQREIQQYVRGAQVARGNSEGGAQTVQEAMTQGYAGQALQQQRQQMLAQGMNLAQQGVALENLPQQEADALYAAGSQNIGTNLGLQNAPSNQMTNLEQQISGLQGSGQALQAQALSLQQNPQNYLNSVLNQATGYLGSGQTQYGQGSTYLSNAINQQNAALGGYPIQQNAQPTPPSYLYLDPAAGAQFAQGTQGFMNQGVGATIGSPGSTVPWGAIAGAGGSVLGGLLGSVVPGVGTVVGAGLGGLAGTAIGSGASGGFCWVAREVFGADNQLWLRFRDWLLTKSPTWLMQFYAKNGQGLAIRIKNKPRIKRVIKSWMETQLAT